MSTPAASLLVVSVRGSAFRQSAQNLRGAGRKFKLIGRLAEDLPSGGSYALLRTGKS